LAQPLPLPSVQTGVRTVAGTDWPVVTCVKRHAEWTRHGRPAWVVLVDLCNGTPSHAILFTTRREALAYYVTVVN
jgi:hypothetical protein